MTVNVARFTNATLPALTNFSARLSFAQNALSLERFGGDLAGGPFTMSGRVTFPKLTEPTLDLQLKANSVLVARNDTLTARADADITVKGPFATATVSGNVAMTNSHILEEHRPHSDRPAWQTSARAAIRAAANFFSGPATPRLEIRCRN